MMPLSKVTEKYVEITKTAECLDCFHYHSSPEKKRLVFNIEIPDLFTSMYYVMLQIFHKMKYANKEKP